LSFRLWQCFALMVFYLVGVHPRLRMPSVSLCICNSRTPAGISPRHLEHDCRCRRGTQQRTGACPAAPSCVYMACALRSRIPVCGKQPQRCIFPYDRCHDPHGMLPGPLLCCGQQPWEACMATRCQPAWCFQPVVRSAMNATGGVVSGTTMDREVVEAAVEHRSPSAHPIIRSLASGKVNSTLYSVTTCCRTLQLGAPKFPMRVAQKKPAVTKHLKRSDCDFIAAERSPNPG
jgi:hypothetical protein